jgi:hypothetical protein
MAAFHCSFSGADSDYVGFIKIPKEKYCFMALEAFIVCFITGT